MHFVSSLVGLAAASGLAVAQSPPLSDYSSDDIASGSAFRDVSDLALERQRNNINSRNSGCSYDDAEVRTEFRSMSNNQRKAFTDAVDCLHHTPPQVMTDAERSDYPGVFTRYDEYVATHINFTTRIHMTADFFAWHRHFIYSFEQDLRNLCGYNGNLPYWDWAADAENVDESEIFNGDEWSMGSNGEVVGGRDNTWLAAMDIVFPPGTGGGCVHSGPFSDFVTNLGPLASPYDNNVDQDYQHNRRCLTRDLNSWFSRRYNTYTNVTELLLNSIYLEDFQALSQGYGDFDNALGIHGGGHWLGGGPSQLEDFFSSPNDPIFYIHHGMMDRIWTIWQNIDIYHRQNVIHGTSTLNNDPPSDPMQLSDTLEFGFVGPDVTFGDLMDTFAGPYCYRYD